jgi:malonyl-CoA/methylmalonyl-CoA synthetase
VNITDPIWRNAESFPDRLAILVEGQALTFGLLRRDIEGAAANLARRGIVSGQRVLVGSPNPVLHLVAVLALARIGATSIATDHALAPEIQAELARKFGATAFVRSFEDWKNAAIPAAAHILANTLIGDRSGPSPVYLDPGDCADRTWRIALSSGTTGLPKGIPWTHGHAAQLLELLQTAWPCGASERLMILMGTGATYTINQILRQLAAGGAVVVPKTAEGRDVFAAIARHGVTQVFTSTAGAWNLLQYAKTVDPAEIVAARRVRHFVLGGSAVSPALQMELREWICPNLAITYGSTESGMVVRADADTLRHFPHAAGHLVPWADAEVMDDEGRPLPRGSHGLLRFRMPHTASGYEGDPEATAKVFRDGWFYPGDTGSIDENGLVTLGSRDDEVVNIAGIKVDPLAVEAVLDEDPAISECAVIGVMTDRNVPNLVAVVVASGPIDEAALRAKCSERLGPSFVPAHFVTAASLPRNEAGKVLRRQLAESVRFGSQARPQGGNATRH